MKREDWDRRYAESDLLWGAAPNRVLVAEAAELAPGRALDLACGEGRNAIWLAERGWSVLGVDFSEVAISTARARADDEGVAVELLCADLLDFVPAEGDFDLVVSLFLHLAADERKVVLRRAVQALAPAGTLLLVGHDLTNLTDGVGGPSDASVLVTPEDVVADLDGLEIERAERILRDVPGAERPAIDVLVRARAPGVRERGG